MPEPIFDDNFLILPSYIFWRNARSTCLFKQHSGINYNSFDDKLRRFHDEYFR